MFYKSFIIHHKKLLHLLKLKSTSNFWTHLHWSLILNNYSLMCIHVKLCVIFSSLVVGLTKCISSCSPSLIIFQFFSDEKTKLLCINVFINWERQYFSCFLCSIYEWLNSFFSSEIQKKICLMVRKKPYLSPLFKKSTFVNDFRMETEHG